MSIYFCGVWGLKFFFFFGLALLLAVRLGFFARCVGASALLLEVSLGDFSVWWGTRVSQQTDFWTKRGSGKEKRLNG